MKKITFLVLFYINAFVSIAAIRLPAIIGSNMVLQQKSKAIIWGWGSPTEKLTVTASWDQIPYALVVSPDATWKVELQTPSAGGPFNISIKGDNQINLENIMIGEVWICSGQSNMEMNFNWGQLADIKDELPHASNTNIRFFTVAKTAADFPQEDCKGQWLLCDSGSLKSFSAVAYFFGKKLEANLHIPIGLINTSWGATPAEVWTPAGIIENNQVLKDAAAKLTINPWSPVKPGLVYNAMIYPLLNLSVSGAIWYQGEANTSTFSTYDLLLTTMVQTWRSKWKKNFPFYFVQIAPYKYGNKNIAAMLREAQSGVMKLENTGMVVTNDITGDTNDIHPKNKHDVGYRLAGLALSETYHLTSTAYKSPRFKDFTLLNGRAVIHFENIHGTLSGNENLEADLLIAGEDKIFYPAKAKISGANLIVWNAAVKKPVAVRYAFANTAISGLSSPEGLPVEPFRTDNWEVDVSPVK